MQLRAYDEKERIVFAHQAVKQCDYFCLECKGALRLRGGIHRQKHFYHLKPPLQCRQSGKSMEHLQVQCAVKELFGDECVLELPFPTIGRIADCVWLPQKIVFEVQCSPITQEEVAKRNADYASAGYRAIWLLHDGRFNQKRLTAAELWLRDHPHYFTDIDADGNGDIYDQYDVAERGQRRRVLEPASVNLKGVYIQADHHLPAELQQRIERWRMGFEGDWVQRATEEKYQQYLSEIFNTDDESFHSVIRTYIAWVWNSLIVLPYRIVFAYLLEKACR